MSGDFPEMRASDAERERVAEALREAVAEGRLTMEEFDERLEAAYTARTHADLEPLVRDLPVPAALAHHAARPVAAGEGADPTWPERIGAPATSRWGVGVLGGFQRAGRWVMPRAFTSVVVMGGGEIDLREARFEDRDVVVRCFALMGGVSVLVPPDVEVNVTGIGIMGGFDQKATGDGAPGAPRVTVTGLAIWGGVGVERKRRKADIQREKDARREAKAERKRLRKERESGHLEPGGPAAGLPGSGHPTSGHPALDRSDSDRTERERRVERERGEGAE